MSIGISDWVGMEEQPAALPDPHLGELAELLIDGDPTVVEVLSWVDPDTVAVWRIGVDPDEDEDVDTVPVPVDELRALTSGHGPFVIVTRDADGGAEVAHYFRTSHAARSFAASTDDEVLTVEGLMA